MLTSAVILILSFLFMIVFCLIPLILSWNATSLPEGSSGLNPKTPELAPHDGFDGRPREYAPTAETEEAEPAIDL